MRRLSLLLALVLPLLAFADSVSPRERANFDAGWRFAFGHPSDATKDFNHGTGYFSYLAKAGYADGPADPKFDASAWRQLDVPHDWAVEAPFDAKGSHSHGYKAIGRNFPERRVGWYRKTFTIPAADLGRRVRLEFDGVHRDSQVFVNGFFLGHQLNGSTSFTYDLTDYLNYGGENVVAVRVDVTMEEGWYYEGAGIHRHVWLTKNSPLHVAYHGTFVSSELNAAHDHADITARAEITNASAEPAAFTLTQTLLAPDGSTVVARHTSPALTLAAGVTQEFTAALALKSPALWSLKSPALHTLVTTVLRADGTLADRYETPFGIRSVRFDPNHGFFLNGEHVVLKGTNIHQDHAGVGVATPDALLEYRVRRLQAFGSNAIRTSHEPPNPVLLEICDRLGMLVIDETRLMGASPAQLEPLAAMIRRDRNHPSVIIWSVGNEEWRIEGNILGARLTATMQAFARRLDPTRRNTVAISGGWGGSSTTTDVVGYNYINQSNPDDQHAKFPHQPGIGTEETTTQGTRGIYFDDRPRSHLAPMVKGDSGGNCEKGWQYYAARPFLSGIFFWTGFDYRGESTPLGWPAISSQYGIMDTCGFPKDSFYYLKSWWSDEPVLYLFPHWNLAGREGQAITVACFSNHDEVELLLNGASLGKQAMPRNGRLEWKVIYAPGTLEARGFRGGKQVATHRVETTGTPAKLSVTADRAAYRADGVDVVVVNVAALDAQGRVVPVASNFVKFAVTGGRIIGVGNGDPGCLEPDVASERSLFNGYAQVLVQTSSTAGDLTLTATSDGLASATTTVPVK